MEKSNTFIGDGHKKILAEARLTLCKLTDDPVMRIHPASQEYSKVMEIVGEIESLMGII